MQLHAQDGLTQLTDAEVSQAPLLRDVAEQSTTEVVHVPFPAAALKAWARSLSVTVSLTVSGKLPESELDAHFVCLALQVGPFPCYISAS